MLAPGNTSPCHQARHLVAKKREPKASEANHSMLAALNNFRFKLFNKVMLSKVLNKVFKKQKAQHWHMSHEELSDLLIVVVRIAARLQRATK